jgi:hypothetical protein
LSQVMPPQFLTAKLTFPDGEVETVNYKIELRRNE